MSLFHASPYSQLTCATRVRWQRNDENRSLLVACGASPDCARLAESTRHYRCENVAHSHPHTECIIYVNESQRCFVFADKYRLPENLLNTNNARRLLRATLQSFPPRNISQSFAAFFPVVWPCTKPVQKTTSIRQCRVLSPKWLCLQRSACPAIHQEHPARLLAPQYV